MTAARKRGTGEEAVRSGHLLRSAAWSGLRPGDPVSVAGTRLRAASWSFVAHVRNAETGDEWVEVVGGRAGDRKLRSFRPEQIFPPGAGGSRGSGVPSLAEAPRLPLG